METIAVAIAETFDFMQPFCSVAMRKQAAFESAPIVKGVHSSHTLATETDLTNDARPDRGASSIVRVQYLQQRCDTSLTSSLSEDEMLLPYNPSYNSQSSPPHHYHHHTGAVPEQVTFFTPRQRDAHVHLSGLSLQWHVRRAAGGHKGIDEWTGLLCEQADAREDVDECLGTVSCYRISPTFQMPVTEEEQAVLAAVHPQLADLAQYMTANTTLPYAYADGGMGGVGMSSSYPLERTEKPLFGLPLVLITHVQVTEEHRGMGLGLLLVDETCRCLANPAQWVLLATPPSSSSPTSTTDRIEEQAQEEEKASSSGNHLREYFGLLGFSKSGLLDGQVIVRWNDPYCMATHRYEDLCPHLPRVAIQ